MPVEIKELVIKAEISDSKSEEDAKGASLSKVKMEDLVVRCAEKVIEILEDRKEL